MVILSPIAADSPSDLDERALGQNGMLPLGAGIL
jgi:hypothetical protein